MKRIQIIYGVEPLRWVIRGPRRWDFQFWFGQSRTLRLMLGGPLR
jgi:hypothetical protein